MALAVVAAITVVAACPSAEAKVDAQAEVAAAVYYASATVAATQRADDAKLHVMRQQIEALQAQVREKAAQHQSELTTLQKRYVAELTEKDRAYGEAIAQFRGAVTDIASTPDGAAALAQYNAGHEVEALATLDRLRAADDQAAIMADKNREAIASAQRARSIALLAYQSFLQQKIDIKNIIDRYEEIIKLDPRNFNDWIQLSDLYGDYDKKLFALKSAVDNASTRCDKLEAWSEVTIRYDFLGRYEDSYYYHQKIIEYYSDQLSEDPKDDNRVLNVAMAISSLESELLNKRSYSQAVEYAKEIVKLDYVVVNRSKLSIFERDLAEDLGRLGYVADLNGNLDLSVESYRRAIDILEKLTKVSPGLIDKEVKNYKNSDENLNTLLKQAEKNDNTSLKFDIKICGMRHVTHNSDTLRRRYRNLSEMLDRFSKILLRSGNSAEYAKVMSEISSIEKILKIIQKDIIIDDTTNVIP